jgi:hypothetical protein
LNASGTRLEGITKELRTHWQQTRDQWHDAKALEFDAKYLQELFSGVDKAVSVIDQIDKLMARIRKDCE